MMSSSLSSFKEDNLNAECTMYYDDDCSSSSSSSTISRNDSGKCSVEEIRVRPGVIRRRPHVAGLILARGGSRGIPLKNLAPLGGKPLLSWSLETINQFGKFDSVWVSTDHASISEVALSHPGVSVFKRSPLYARDDTPSILSLQEFVNQRTEVDVVCLMQCTSPFLRVNFLQEAWELSHKFDSIFSVTRQKKFRWQEVSTSTSFTKPLNFDVKNRPRRQDWKGDLVENGMFYLTKRQFIEQGILQGGRTAYVEVPSEYSLEIDSPLDLSFAEQVLAHEYV